MHTVPLDPDLVETIAVLQTDSTKDVEEAVRVAANEAVRSVLHQLRESMLEAEQTIFEARHAELLDEYLGKYVAMYHGAVVDSDIDERTLYLRVHRQYPNAVIGIFPVRESREMPVHQFIGARLVAQIG